MALGVNVVTYSSRFAGDLVSLMVGTVSALPLAFGYFSHPPSWLTSDVVKWGALTCGFVFVSFRLWLRSEHSRTSDAFNVLVIDAANIYAHIKVMMEDFPWPPQDSETRILAWPFRDKGLVTNLSLLRMLCDEETRIYRHNELVLRIAQEHGVDIPDILLDPTQLSATTMLNDIRDYIESLKAVAMPPSTWLAHMSTRRCQR